MLSYAAANDCALWDIASCRFTNHSIAMSTGPLRLVKLWPYLHGSSSTHWSTSWIQGNLTLTQWSFTNQYGLYGLKFLVMKVFPLNSSISTSSWLRLCISYNLICIGRAGQGAFFFWCSLANSLVEMWYETSCMMTLSMTYFGKTCGGFSVFYI